MTTITDMSLAATLGVVVILALLLTPTTPGALFLIGTATVLHALFAFDMTNPFWVAAVAFGVVATVWCAANLLDGGDDGAAPDAPPDLRDVGAPAPALGEDGAPGDDDPRKKLDPPATCAPQKDGATAEPVLISLLYTRNTELEQQNDNLQAENRHLNDRLNLIRRNLINQWLARRTHDQVNQRRVADAIAQLQALDQNQEVVDVIALLQATDFRF